MNDQRVSSSQTEGQKSGELKSVRNWSVGVTTAPRRRPTLRRCLASLVEAGWEEPRLFAEAGTEIPSEYEDFPLTWRTPALGAFPNWYLSLAEMVMREPLVEAYLLCQDDVVLSAGLREYLEKSLWPDSRVGLVSAYCPSHYAKEKDSGFHIEDRGWKSWGALAYVFPNPSARAVLADPLVISHRHHGPAEGMRNIDSVVGSWAVRNRLPYYVHVPSLGQHIGTTSTIWTRGGNGGRRRAGDFIEQVG